MDMGIAKLKCCAYESKGRGFESLRAHQEALYRFSGEEFFLCKQAGIRRGAGMNDVPVARQNYDRPRRGARRESNPSGRTKKLFTGFPVKSFSLQTSRDSKGSCNE